MELSRGWLAIAIFCAAGFAPPLGAATSADAAWPPGAARRTHAQNYADIALALCVAEAYASEPRAKEDALASASGIDAWSNYDLERASAPLRDLVKRTLAQERHAYRGPQVRLDLMKCIDMVHGPELARQIRLFAPSPNRAYQDDDPPTKK